MEKIKPIRSQKDLERALIRIDTLMGSAPDSLGYDELQVLVDLVELYENKNVPIDLPSPLAAIEFRMDQAGLKPRDLIPILGSKTAVSEVLSGKRPLTMGMARSLHEKLGIPAELLLKETKPEITSVLKDWAKFPLKTMKKFGWIVDVSEKSFAKFVEESGCCGKEPQALYRKTDTSRVNAKSDIYALNAWRMQVMRKANALKLKVAYLPSSVDEDFLKEIVSLSVHPDGPKQAQTALAKKGIALIMVPHLPKTHLDGAAFIANDHPIIGMSLRYDRIDNFWFCLLHELAHIGRHLDTDPNESFIDDHSLRSSNSKDRREREADEWADKALISQAQWDASSAKNDSSPESVMALAMSIRRHAAIIAGRIRYEKKNYRLLSQFVGNGAIRKQFWEVKSKAS